MADLGLLVVRESSKLSSCDVLYNRKFVSVSLVKFHAELFEAVTRILDSSTKVTEDEIQLFFESLWGEYQLVVFQYFIRWKEALWRDSARQRKKCYVEFRKLRDRSQQLFKKFHRLYYSIIEYITARYDISNAIPVHILGKLNLDKVSHRTKQMPTVVVSDRYSITTRNVTCVFYHCLINLGRIHYCQKMVEEPIHHEMSRCEFTKAERYLTAATIIIPALSTSYTQLYVINNKKRNYLEAIYQLVRSSRTRIGNAKATETLQFFFKLNNIEKLFQEQKDIDGVGQVTWYTFMLISYHMDVSLRRSTAVESQKSKANVQKLLNQALHNHVPQIIDKVFQIMVILIGTFHTMLSVDLPEIENLHAVNVNKLHYFHSDYLEFIFEYFITLIDNVATDDHASEIAPLAIVRLMIGWIKCNRPVLHKAHRHVVLCTRLAMLVNVLIKKLQQNGITQWSIKPTRSYYFKEDVLLKNFSCIRDHLTDFMDDEIDRKRRNIINRLAGFPPRKERLDFQGENSLRSQAVVAALIKFLSSNNSNTRWNDDMRVFDIS
ncbi:Est1p KNAG_0A02570 [Huiozyma naganishii CBS 8797]|uniref:Uncharacterized protein n=1 Tax=Huiozyma naganishii (strain ATCC MYA-139 / BCRC 22969 / CBS 8797 / KCTC 17520 / NBRC 10181 / NCYC 3082 / Yp74L-3) TaxID=1071383 RepID=J7S3E4_HUIN7|nr:hypothetical protein KNAG_0A02570 [Kazachstania naganishii CBS 8797]CCK67946.1 hypothetical protein KNAG_0A02570 [Kazachstania naganishii CBS 8797]